MCAISATTVMSGYSAKPSSIPWCCESDADVPGIPSMITTLPSPPIVSANHCAM